MKRAVGYHSNFLFLLEKENKNENENSLSITKFKITIKTDLLFPVSSFFILFTPSFSLLLFKILDGYGKIKGRPS